jgi:hypothetical protein
MGALSDLLGNMQAAAATCEPGAAAARDALAVLIARGQQVAAAADAVERGKASQFSLPRQTVLDLANDLATFNKLLWDEDCYPSELFTALRDAQRGLYNFLLYRRGWTMTQGLTAGVSSRTYGPDYLPLVPYIVRPGDTLERLALRLLADVKRSWEVIDLNDLVAPFFDTGDQPCTTGPGIARPGDQIFLPPDALVPQQETSRTEMDIELYGRDMKLLDTGYVTITIDELATVEGIDNISQALIERIYTTVGELVLHPEYGIQTGLVVGVPGTDDQIAFNGLEVSRTVATDPRVTRVSDVDSKFSSATTADEIRMNVWLIGPSQRALPLNVVLPDILATTP